MADPVTWKTLHRAVEEGNDAVARSPLDKVANISIKDDNSKTVLRLAAEEGNEIKLPAGWEQRQTDSSRSHFVDHNTRTTTWASPVKYLPAQAALDLAADEGNEAVGPLLLDKGANISTKGVDISAKDGNGREVLHLAAEKGNKSNRMSFSLWPSTVSPGSLGSPSDGGEKQLSTPALDFIGAIHEARIPIVHYRNLANLYSAGASRFVGSGTHAVVEIAKRSNGAWVAIKRMRSSGHSDGDIATYSDRRLAEVTLELRILTLEEIRRHPHIINVQGVCYEESVANPNTVGIGQFHLVLEYSQLGDMASFLRQNGQQIDIKAKIDLVRQVGCGLFALHEFSMGHGDLKIQNVLVFNGKDGGHVAKLADFGMSRHSHETEIYYAPGTPLLNAPEVRNRYLSTQPVDIAAVIRADIFSFGLLMWETIQDGRPYFNPAWMDTYGASSLEIGVEEQMEFLLSLPHNGLLLRGEEFLSTQNLDNQLYQQILGVFQASLQDEPLQRQQISDIVEAMPMHHENSSTSFKAFQPFEIVSAHSYLGFRTWADPYLQYNLSDYIFLDLPDNFQRRALDELKMCVNSSSTLDDMRQHAAHKIAECYLISFGTDYDSAEVLRWLKIAKSCLGYTGPCLDRISEALGYPLEVSRRPETQLMANREDNDAKGPAASELYLAGKIQSTATYVVNKIQKMIIPSQHFEMSFSAAVLVETGLSTAIHTDMTALDVAAFLGDNENVAKLLLTADPPSNSKKQLNAVHYACIGGNLSTLKLVLDQGVDSLLRGPSNITALHCLIFMPADVVGSALDLLVAHGALMDIKSKPILVPKTDLRLVGTPLEWAVVARNRALVVALLPHSKGQEGSMLRLAVQHAYYEIAAVLFSNDAFRNVVTTGNCPLFVVHRPFSHLLVHGRDGNLAIERTIRLCDKYGIIDYDDMLRGCICHARTQSCIKSIEVLLDLCAPTTIRYGFDTEDIRLDENLNSTLYLAFSSAKANMAWKSILEVMVRYFSVAELDEIKERFNALHMAVFRGWTVAVRVLLEKGVDVHRRTKSRLPMSSFDLAVSAMDFKTMEILSEFGGADSFLDNNGARKNGAWWLQHQKATMGLGFKGVFYEYVGDKDAALRSVVRHMHVLLGHALSIRDKFIPLQFPDGSNESLHQMFDSLWNDFRVLLSNESVARCVDVPDDNGVTMLQRAVSFLDIDAVRLLLEVGADANVPFLAKKIGGDENDQLIPLLPFQIACCTGRILSSMFESGSLVTGFEATFEETSMPSPKEVDPKTTRKLHFLHRIGLAITHAFEIRAKRIGAKKGDRALTLGIKAAESLRARSLEIALEILHWHQVREDHRFDGITELHLCYHLGYVQRAVALFQQGANTKAKASWPGREGKYNSSELGKLDFMDQWRAWSFAVLRGKWSERSSRMPEEAALIPCIGTQSQAGDQ